MSARLTVPKVCPGCKGDLYHYDGCAYGPHGSKVGIMTPTKKERLETIANAIHKARYPRAWVPLTWADKDHPTLKRMFEQAEKVLTALETLERNY